MGTLLTNYLQKLSEIMVKGVIKLSKKFIQASKDEDENSESDNDDQVVHNKALK